MPAPPLLLTHRNLEQHTAIVFIHGFGGHPAATWGAFPQLIMDDARLRGWDVYSLGYATNLAPDIRGIWRATPPLETLADLLQTAAALPPLQRYASLAFVAHSMGGLVVQRALLDDADLARRVSHVVFFGTPSGGLVKASPFRFWKRQIRDMARGSAFITDLRTRWNGAFRDHPAPFVCLTVAGDLDEFVPRTSSLSPFPDTQHWVIPGDHLQIVKPAVASSLGVQVVFDTLIGSAAPDGPWNSARTAVESRNFQRAIALLMPHQDELDDDGAVQLALALEGVGRGEEALALLERQGRSGTDAQGVLAGRLKRRWLVEHRRTDAERAFALYQAAYNQAVADGDAEQASYHGINLAFLTLAYENNPKSGKRRPKPKRLKKARQLALAALQHTAQAAAASPVDYWQRATEGEAYLLLGKTAKALNCYRQALALNPPPRAIASMYQQATRTADLAGAAYDTMESLEALFRHGHASPDALRQLRTTPALDD